MRRRLVLLFYVFMWKGTVYGKKNTQTRPSKTGRDRFGANKQNNIGPHNDLDDSVWHCAFYPADFCSV